MDHNHPAQELQNTGVDNDSTETAGVHEPAQHLGDRDSDNNNQSNTVNNQILKNDEPIEHDSDDENISTTSEILAKPTNHDVQTEMNVKYGTRTRSGLHDRNQRLSVPRKFRSSQDTEEQLHTMSHEQLDLRDYAQLYAKIHRQFNVGNNDHVMMTETVTDILTQYHVSKGL